MKSRVYYGEYTLSHWIDLILSHNIVLPDYQRLFVWTPDKVKHMIESIKNDEFIPPITIGVFKENNHNVNYILDGQQRLTSLLLSLFRIFPKKGNEVAEVFRVMNENDDEPNDDDNDESFFKWTFKELTKLGNTFDEIKDRISKELYDDFELGLSTSFYYKHYLGFSYIVPEINDDKEQQKFYASVFRNINIRGTALSAMESRESLYFLDKEKTLFFKPDLSEYKVSNKAETTPIDFVRYMALLSQFKKVGRENDIARGYGTRSKIEDYYEMYIYSTVGEKNVDIFTHFDEIFPDGKYQNRLDILKQTMKDLDLPLKFGSIIEVDTYFFGLIYTIILENQRINVAKKEDLKNQIEATIKSFKDDPYHKKSPASLKYLRKRIADSIKLYSKYVYKD